MRVPTATQNSKCYLTFDADFKWYDDDSDFVPTISGGLVAVSRMWFNLTGGFDTEMHGWGGENLDQSLRTWLCGGEIVRARSSRIAHMWRTSDRRTAKKYVVKAKATNNRARAANAWFDAYLPVYRGSRLTSDNFTDFEKLKQRLRCKPFTYFLYRFRKLYVGGGVIPQKVFRVRDRATQLCMEGRSNFRMVPCKDTGTQQHFHVANIDSATGECCSGIRFFASNQCFDYVDRNGLHGYSCDITGKNLNQLYHFRADGRIQKGMRECLFVLEDKTIGLRPCHALTEDQGVFEQVDAYEPEVFSIYTSELAKLGYEEEFPNLPDK